MPQPRQSSLALLSFLGWRQIGYWRSDYDLWSNAVKVTKNNVLAEASLGRALRLLDRQEEALPHYEQAARLSPEDPVRHLNLAVDLTECGRLQDAIEEYQAATHLTSDDKIRARTYACLGAYSAHSEITPRFTKAIDRPCSLILRRPMKWFVTFPKVLPASQRAKAICGLGCSSRR